MSLPGDLGRVAGQDVQASGLHEEARIIGIIPGQQLDDL